MRNFKYIKPYIILFATLLFFSNKLVALTGKYPIQNFTSSDYKAGIQNIDFAQNRDMTLYVANNLGVLEYNSADWNVHIFKPGKKKRSLAFDEKNNRLYVGLQEDFGYFDDKWNYISLTAKIPEEEKDFDEVWDVFILNGAVYFCTFQKIYVYNGSSIHVITHEDGFKRTFYTNDKLLVQSRAGEIFELGPSTLKKIQFLNPKQKKIAGLIYKNNGYLVFYASGTIEFFTAIDRKKQYSALSQRISGKYINHVLQLSDGRVVIATQAAGLYIFDALNNKIEQITKKDGLQSNTCLRVFQDFSGNLWVGMQNGMALVNLNSPIRFINEKIDLHGSGYEVFEQKDGTYYSTSNGIFYLKNGMEKSIFLNETKGPSYSIQEFYGHLYACHHTGLFLLKDGNAKRIAETPGLWQLKQLQVHPEYVVGGTYSGLFLFKLGPDKILEPVRLIEGFSESSRFFEEDNKGNIWVGQFYKGLYELEFSKDLSKVEAKKITKENDSAINEQIILNKINNQIFIGTQKGVYWLNQQNNTIEKAPFFETDIGEQTIYLLKQDNQNNIHIITEHLVGFFRQISSNNYSFTQSSLFSMMHSFNNDLLNVSVNTFNGVLFNANEGFIYYQPELENLTAVQDAPFLSKLISVQEDSVLFSWPPFGDRLNETEFLTFSHRSSALKFEVESFNYEKINNHQFRYILKGFDNDFNEWSSTTTKEYTNLKEGDYEFMVQTKNNLGEIISSAPFQFKIEPPFYRTLLAKIIYALLGIIAFSSLFLKQKKHYQTQIETVEVSKQQELSAIEQEKERELAKLKEDKVKSELQHVQNLLAASTMNLVVKNEFMETIKGKIQSAKQKGSSKEIKQSLDKIIKEITSTLKLQEDWVQFEYHFDQVHGNFLNRLREEFQDLTPNEQKLCAFLRLNLNTKEIANLMGISHRGIEVARYRLRKKLALDKGKNLSKFILEY